MFPRLSLRLAGLVALASTLFAHEGLHHHEADDSRLAVTSIPNVRITVDKDGKPNPWNHLDFHNDPSAFQFAIVSDRTGGSRAGIFEKAVAKLNLLQPEFVMSVGDLIEGYSQNPSEIHAQWDEFQGFIQELEMPFFYLPGNHDQSNSTMAAVWQERFGRSYYSFIYHDVLFLCLNSQDTDMDYLSEKQLQWVRDTLAAHTEVRWTLVFLHSPLWETANLENSGWLAVEEALQDRKYTVFAGHYHSYLKRERHDSRYYILSTTGGGSRLRGPAYGEFDQVGWVTMTKDGPLLANLMLDGILAEDVLTPEKRSLALSLTDELIQSRVIWSSTEAKSEHRAEIFSANRADVPVTVNFSLEPAPGMSLQLEQGLAKVGSSYSFTLQPKASRALFVKAIGQVAGNGHQANTAGRVRWQATLNPPDMGPLALHGDILIPFVPRLTLPVAPSHKVDGDLTEWEGLLHAVEQPHEIPEGEGWTGLNDCRFSVGFARDDQNFYIAVDVKDEDLVSQGNMVPWRQDGIEVRIDFRDPKIQRAARVTEHGLLFIASCPAPGDGFDPAYIYSQNVQPAGTVICSKQIDGGYTFEAAIPLAEIAEQFGEEWKQHGVRINIAVNDRDSDGRQTQLWWQPDWRVEENIPGSGTLFWE